MADDHDLRYKKLFSHPKLVEELIVSFIDEDFVRKIDFSTLEQVNKSFVTADYRKKESDIIYKVKLDGKQDVFIYLLLEFQSTVDKYMALRMLRYICELYEFILHERNNKKFKKLPAVLPLMLYNGDNKWTAKTSIAAIIEHSLPSEYIPQLNYIKIAENEYSNHELLSIRNSVSALFFTENSGIETFMDNIDTLFKLIDMEDGSIKEHFFRWLLNYLKGHDIIYDKMKNQINNITEGKDMLATSIQKTKEQWLNTGMQQGMQQGALDVSRTSVIDILELRFKMVPSFLKEKINRCDNLDELKKLHRQSVIIKSINEFKFI